MGVDRYSYIGPYLTATQRVQKLKYENLACPNKRCRSNKTPRRMEEITIKFCQDCGSKMEMKTFEEDYNSSLYEILKEKKFKSSERLSEIDSYQCDKLKKGQVVFLTNVKFKHSKHFDENESLLCDFIGDKDQSHAMGEFRDEFDKELKVIHENYDDLDYCFGLVSWFS